MAQIYEHEYAPVSVYRNAVSLLREYAARDGVHIDIGCGFGAVAEPIQAELGLTYLGFDLADDGLESLTRRGFEAHRVDLRSPLEAEELILRAAAGRSISSITFMDTLEHLNNGVEVLGMLRRIAERSAAVLVVSVPNVSHKDLALKLMLGRWDVTDAGLLDHTHVAFYTNARLARVMAAVGWRELGSRDWSLEHSDQDFPVGVPLLDSRAPVGRFLRALIDQAHPYGTVNQFVRAYRPQAPQDVVLFESREREAHGPLLSIALVTDGKRADQVLNLLQDLEKQTNQDYELTIVLHFPDPSDKAGIELVLARLPRLIRERIYLGVSEPGSRTEALNDIIAHAPGRYLVLAHEGDRLQRHWVAAFAELAELEPGAVLRIGRAVPAFAEGSADSETEPPHTEADDIIPLPARIPDSVVDFAIPAHAVRYLGLRLDSSAECGSERMLVIQAALLCGLAHSPRVALPISAELGDGSRPEHDLGLSTARDNILAKLDAQPLLLPPGTVERIHRLGQQKRFFESKHEELIDALRQAHSETESLRQELSRAARYQKGLEQGHEALRAALELARENQLALAEERRRLDAEHATYKGLYESFRDSPMLRSLMATFVPHVVPDWSRHTSWAGDSRPFLTVITRTQGTSDLRVNTLREMLVSLAGQSCQDFELVLVVHNESDRAVQIVDALANEFPPELRERIKVIACSRPGRAAPLNDALPHARGEYIAILDDDDFVFGHWVETFRNLADQEPGKLLRATCTRQDFDTTSTGNGSAKPRAVSWFKMDWPGTYDVVSHLSANYTPFMSFAFPGAVFRTFGWLFDEDLSTLEDWHFATRVALLCGVAGSPEITAVYRWWTKNESSTFMHSPEEWSQNRQRVVDRLDQEPIILPPGAVTRIARLVDPSHLNSELSRLGSELAAAEERRKDWFEPELSRLARELAEAQQIMRDWLEPELDRRSEVIAGIERDRTQLMTVVAGLVQEVIRLAQLEAAKKRASKYGLPRLWGNGEQTVIEPERLHELALEPPVLRNLTRSSGLFDPDWYLDQNPDVASSGEDPLEHFAHHGCIEGRSPGPQFDSDAYCRENADIEESGIPAFVHFLVYGLQECRNAIPFESS